MPHNRQQLLDALRFELRFLQDGGYEPSVRDPRKELTVFRDSPSCLNYASATREHPCSECWLMNFVPPEKRGEAVPCHHIPLNQFDETIADIRGDGLKMREAVEDWLRKAIEQLENEEADAAHAPATTAA